ncbi:MAG: bifunctional phosphopantothenoylcysteine decarboxylase/phosphopantothenate--cysteine ligase CoaBC [Porticoccaceae bacterium]|nr:bifunctional phosphopantothenoylcysteine decarboxylase/phosphopantothenate--cysteine ligase CoaBC [Pseudomonadales bacterium]MCP5172861.1 bifunctional phosphopantothenoylcysteine decarboxylase/phosphopantothenate--cysteine ligase CoaBC [Pseudomonadales bacterium]MCP5302335.1 bifunctional phosphopantothenoylcysteine decarboxylase/phosphopantothenate--cysteine ligase CoaBC [Pseudomonadales bacterium]
MRLLTNKRILLGITGGIAAYKSAELVRRLQTIGAEVRVAMTPGATQFITPLTLQALSGNPVHLDLLDTAAEAAMGHIELSRWADLILIAPASANFIAKLANGESGELLSAICLASRSPLALAPAMNQGMWRNASTQKNVKTLRSRGIHFFGPAEGEQACGDVGPGRMSEPEDIAQLTADLFETGSLTGRKVVITAGPTREAIDPVRYITNHSSGKMGYALAEAAVEAGAETILVSGPVNIPPPDRVTIIHVTSAEEMFEAAVNEARNCDLFIASAAVADYRPATVSRSKIKKSADTMTIELIRNPDIVSAVAALPERPFTVGFAAETSDVENYARSKLERKNLDLVIANDVSDKTIGFNSDDNEVLVIENSGAEAIPKINKAILARQLIARIAETLPARKSASNDKTGL